MKKICIKSKVSLVLSIVAIVLALLLMAQTILMVWLYPHPVQSISETPFVSYNSVCAAADALERTYFFRSFRTRCFLLNIVR